MGESCWTAAVQYSGQAKDAYVCGTFSNWKKIPMVKSQKDFVALIGEHGFIFLKIQYGLPRDKIWPHLCTILADQATLPYKTAGTTAGFL